MILKGKQAKEKLLLGINNSVDLIKLTLGLRGKTVLISNNYRMAFSVTKDGVTVANSISFEDDIENCGADFVKNAANKTVEEAGDGTTSTSILTQSMCNDMYSAIMLGHNPNILVKDLKSDLEQVVSFIKSKSKKVETLENIKNIATVSANNDEEIGNLLENIYSKIGFKGEISVEQGDAEETTFKVVNGFSLRDTGFASNQFINNTDKGRVEFVNPRVMIYNGKIREMSQALMDIFKDNSNRAQEDFRPLVLIVEDIEEAVLREVVMAVSREMIFDVAIVQSNLIAQDRKDSMIDASIFLNSGYSEDKLTEYGSCEKIIIEKNSTTFINGEGSGIEEHLGKLRNRLKKEKNNIGLQQRIFSLESNAAIITVGGKITSEISEKKDRVDDSVQAVKSAISEGYSPGGSTVYLFANKELELKTDIMKKALESCYKQLMVNAEIEPYYFLKEIYDSEYGHGYNLKTDTIEDFIENGILDSTKVLRVAIENATHTACNFAMIEATISK